MRYEPAPRPDRVPAHDRALMIVAADADAAERLAAVAQASGARALAPVPPERVGEAISEQARVDGVLVDLSGVPEPLAVEALARLDGWARERALPVVASFAPAQLDLVAAQLGAADAVLLCDPTPAEHVATLAVALARPAGMRLHDAASEAERQRVQRLHDEVARIAETLARLARTDPPPARETRAINDRRTRFDAAPAGDDAVDPALVRAAIQGRRLREKFFARDLFADPAWDMLLDLFAAHLERARVSVSSLCIAAEVPPTTALRWIGTMREAGLFAREDDPFDRRRAFMALTPKAVTAMQAYCSAARRAGLAIA